MEPESSKENIVDSILKPFLDEKPEAPVKKEKFAKRRQIVWPKELFIELKLKKKDVLKVKKWRDQGHSFYPMWFWSCERVLFVDQEAMEDWTREKAKHE